MLWEYFVLAGGKIEKLSNRSNIIECPFLSAASVAGKSIHTPVDTGKRCRAMEKQPAFRCIKKITASGGKENTASEEAKRERYAGSLWSLGGKVAEGV